MMVRLIHGGHYSKRHGKLLNQSNFDWLRKYQFGRILIRQNINLTGYDMLKKIYNYNIYVE